MLRKFIRGLYENDPFLWAWAVEKFRREDRRNPPPSGAILFTGSSSIRFWDTLEQDMAPYPVINRGFGGSMIHQVLHYVEDIVLPYRPRAIFLYAGENDIAGLWFTRRHSAQEVCDNFKAFFEHIQEEVPGTPVYFISIKPARGRQKYWPEMQRANDLIRRFCERHENAGYIDIVPAMRDSSGKLHTDFFIFDGVHMNKRGYAAWTAVIRPVVAAVMAGESD
jgi:lysophospholipase L1-like esterase